MTQPAHQLGQRRARLRGQHRPGVPQIVESQVGASGGGAGPVVVALERRRGQVPIRIRLCREQQRI
jgi:hypothetical protein